MKKPSSFFLTYAALAVSLSLTACSEKAESSNTSQNVTEQLSAQKNAAIAAEFVNQASDSAAHWLTPELLVLPKSNDLSLIHI